MAKPAVRLGYRGDSIDLGVALAAAAMPPFAYDAPLGHDHRAHHRVGRGEASAVGGKLEGAPHVFFVVGHHTIAIKIVNL